MNTTVCAGNRILGLGNLGEPDALSAVAIGPDRYPSARSAQLHGDDGSESAFMRDVREGYRAHVKSSGRGIRRPVGMVRGCLRRASVSSWPASEPTNSSPSATTAYRPPYFDTSSPKCRRTQASSFRDIVLTRGDRTRRIMELDSWSRVAALLIDRCELSNHSNCNCSRRLLRLSMAAPAVTKETTK